MPEQFIYLLAAWVVLLAIWFAAIIPIAMSERGTGVERAVWALVAALVSWVGYVGFLLSTRTRADGQGLRNG